MGGLYAGEEFKANALLSNYTTENANGSITTTNDLTTLASSSNGSSYWAAKGMRLGVARLPGSSIVLDRSQGRLVPCDNVSNLCPFAHRQQLYDGRVALVNFAPYSAFGGWMGSVSQLAPAPYQRRAFDFFAFVASPANCLHDVLDATTEMNPFRDSLIHDDGDSGESFSRWLATGYEHGATRDYLAAVREALSGGNTVLDIRLQ